jgi:prephenate dehydratase
MRSDWRAVEDGGAQFQRVGFFGPRGTFTEEAVFSVPRLTQLEHVSFPTIPDVLRAAEAGEVSLGVVPIENSIEGTVSATLDHLIFDSDLLIQLEVVLDVDLYLLAPAGMRIEDISTVVSFPHASAQCRRFIHEKLAGATVRPAGSTADAARLVAEEGPSGAAAIAPRLAGEIYGLEVLAKSIEDYDGNQTRFLGVAERAVPTPTGRDKTTVVCFQHADHPGSLHEILGSFATRDINLTKIESRPTKRSLGEYCFVVDLEGHVCDEVVGDSLQELHSKLAGCKFLGSYPAADATTVRASRMSSVARHSADAWLEQIRSLVNWEG